MIYGKRVKNIIVEDDAIELMSNTILNLGTEDDIFGLNDFCEFMENATNDDVMNTIMHEV